MKSEKAFTLVEVILAIGVFAIVAVPIVSMFLDGIKLTSKSENTSEAYAYAQQCIEKLKGGELKIEDGLTDTVPEDSEYTYTIDVLSTTDNVVADGEDFYNYMNETDSFVGNISVSGSSLKVNSMTVTNDVKINSDCDWVIDDTTYSVKKDKIWLKYGDLAEQKSLTIINESGKKLDIYLQWIGSDETKKNNVKIKNLGGIINVYGPVTVIPEKRGRKKTANVTVTVTNDRTGEHAELTANVVYYE